jgi:hypothetical protein
MLFFNMLLLHTAFACQSNVGCSLNGVCSGGKCQCDAAWEGETCQWLSFLPGNDKDLALDGIPLCCYHGDDENSTSWGASVIQAPEDGKFYMWVAQMTNHCNLGKWRTNSEVALARSDNPLGPFTKLIDLVPPWTHNPEAIRAPDESTKSGFVYALYALGDGVPKSGPPANCSNPPKQSPSRPAPQLKRLNSAGRNITANFTIHYSELATGPYKAANASIVNWPSNWDYGAVGNWNPAPFVHKNGSIYLMAHTSWHAFCGEAIIKADTWRGPYYVIASDTYPSWGGTTCGSEDPFMW